VNDLIVDSARRHLARPSDDERWANPAFHRGEICTCPWPVGPLPWVGCFPAVVAGEDDQRIVFNARGLDGIKDLTSAMVHLSETIRPVAVAGAANELRIWQ